MNKIIIVLLFGLSSVTQAESLEFNCTFPDDGNSRIEAKSQDHTFEEPHSSAYTPNSAFIIPPMPDFYVVEGTEYDGEQSEELAFFVTKSLSVNKLSEYAKDILGDMIPLDTIKTFRHGFLTDLYYGATYMEVKHVVDGEELVSKFFVAGLSMGVCE